MRRQQSTARVRPEHQRLESLIRTSAPQQSVTNVWIVGDSYIRRGGEEAAKTLGNNLGLNCRIQWFGKGGMRWNGFLPFFNLCLEGKNAPDVLVVHCGGNDLGQMKSMQLVNAMKRDLQDLHFKYPHMKIIMSSINQRRSWRYSAPVKVEKDRKFINHMMASFIGCVNGTIVHHHEILFYRPELFLRDRVHLSPRGNCLFLSNIANSLKDLMTNW